MCKLFRFFPGFVAILMTLVILMPQTANAQKRKGKNKQPIKLTNIVEPDIAPIVPVVQRKTPQTLVTISGKITKAQNALISLDILDNPINNNILSFASKIDSTGQFTIQLPLEYPTFAWIFHANQSVPVFIHPEDGLTITLNGVDLVNTIKYTGRGAENCRLTTEYYRKFNRATQRSITTQKMSELSPEDFIIYANDLKKQKQQLLSDFKEKNIITALCENFVKAQILAEWAAVLMDFPVAYSFKTNEISPVLPDGYYDFLSEVDFNNEEIMQLNVYTDFLLKYVTHKFNKSINRATYNPENFYADKYEFAKKILSGKALYFVQAISIADACTYSKVELMAPKFDEFIIACPFGNFNQALAEIFDQSYKIRAGQQAPDFTLTNLNGDTITLSQLRGKVVYVDFWATWCGPCIKEFPYSEKLKKRFSHKNVAFVYISVDESQEVWANYLRTKDISSDTSLHLLASALESDAGFQYNVKGVPRYLIIDADGIIADSNAKRPSDMGIISDLEKVLSKSPLKQN
ncbi:MAG: TlpA family protein disulfide reductase [Sphingobacteriales bacterium]|nr:MAG: TlpA family protein disulfide reductase [Sphingobacteriales bacterium]